MLYVLLSVSIMWRAESLKLPIKAYKEKKVVSERPGEITRDSMWNHGHENAKKLNCSSTRTSVIFHQ